MTLATLFCEGYHDRAFVNGWMDMNRIARSKTRSAPKGAYAKVGANGGEFWIVPTTGDGGLRTTVGDTFKVRDEITLVGILVDADGLDLAVRKARIEESIRSVIGTTALEVVVLAPRLEGVVFQALSTAHPNRVDSVRQFLSSREDPPPSTGKEDAQAYCAGWRPDSFGEDFFADVWRDDDVRPELEKLIPSAVALFQRLATR